MTTEVEGGQDADLHCCHPVSKCQKGLALLLICFLSFGSYFCYDNPGALQREITDTMHMTTYQFENLYSWYSWPNVLLPIIGGYLVDNVLGLRLSAIAFAAFILLGQIMTALGVFYNRVWLMQLSRFVFGIGGESLFVAQNTYASAWFSGHALNMVFGLQTSIARAGSTVNFLIVGPIYEEFLQDYGPRDALGWTLIVSAFTCIMSVACASILAIMDKRRLSTVEHLHEEETRVRFRDVLVFPLSFWLLCLICVSYYVTIFPFVTLCKVYFEKKYNFSKQNANFLAGLMYLMSAFVSPFIGYVIDKVGRNLTFVMTAVVMTLASHFILGFTLLNPYFAIVFMGIGYSLLSSALWPIISLTVPINRQGTAFGLINAVQNLGLAAVALAAGDIVDRYGYLWLEIFFHGWLIAAIFATALLWMVDYTRNDGYLNMTTLERVAWTESKNSELSEERSILSQDFSTTSEE